MNKVYASAREAVQRRVHPSQGGKMMRKTLLFFSLAISFTGLSCGEHESPVFKPDPPAGPPSEMIACVPGTFRWLCGTDCGAIPSEQLCTGSVYRSGGTWQLGDPCDFPGGECESSYGRYSCDCSGRIVSVRPR